MQILPLKFISDEDRLLVGDSLVTLAKIKRIGFPVAEILIVDPPLEQIKQTLKKFQFEKPVFEHNFEAFYEEILKVSMPDDFQISLKRRDERIKIWKQLLSLWAKEIRSKIVRDELSTPDIKKLSVKELAFVDNVLSSGKFFFDKSKKDSVIEIEEGKLSPLELNKLDKLAFDLNKKLLIPQVFFWILEEHNKKKEFKIIKILPLTEDMVEEIKDFQDIQKSIDVIYHERSATKIFLQGKNNLPYSSEYINGILLQASDFNDLEEAKIYIAELATKIDSIIFQISNVNLQPGIFEREVEIFNFLRNKKKLLNIEISLPLVKSVFEFAEIKKNLNSLGVYRKGSLKFWMEIGYPENLINIDEYILSGFDGVILNLDLLNDYLNGQHSSYTNTLIKFLEDKFKQLHKSKMPILAKGEIALKGEFLRFLIKNGIWSILAPPFNCPGLNNYLKMIEERVIKD